MLQRLSKMSITTHGCCRTNEVRMVDAFPHEPKYVGELTTSEGSVSAHVSFDTPNRKDLCTVLARVRTRVTQGG